MLVHGIWIGSAIIGKWVLLIFSCNIYEVGSDSRCSRTLLMNIEIEIAHCDCERNMWRNWIRLTIREKANANVAKVGALYQSEIHLTSNNIYTKSFGSNDMADKNTKGIEFRIYRVSLLSTRRWLSSLVQQEKIYPTYL